MTPQRVPSIDPTNGRSAEILSFFMQKPIESFASFGGFEGCTFFFFF
eukprot:CAMPEP_0180170020 /NCGR_PEP_ID=MMETSP0986-20121125/33592_1 /TAXON_ID=697907 /ORGANISM="non described non described, Strain CCMP2293" /LENGTH=46 /DNA_ID= /DNA_START= /DNA_END= /DNA_ORIENTATION=